MYPVLYEYRVIDFAYYSLSHWVAAAVAADFFYYWAHRAVHEWNIGWAAHQAPGHLYQLTDLGIPFAT